MPKLPKEKLRKLIYSKEKAKKAAKEQGAIRFVTKTYSDVAIETIHHPKELPSTNPYVIFTTSDGLTFKGEMPEIAGNAACKSSVYTIRGTYDGKDINYCKIVTDGIKSIPLTGAVFKEQLDAFHAQKGVGGKLQSDDDWNTIINQLRDWGYGNALMAPYDPKVSFVDFLKQFSSDDSCDDVLTPKTAKTMVLNEQVLRYLHPISQRVFSWSPYFSNTSEMKEVLIKALGDKCEYIYPHDTLTEVAEIIRTRPTTLFFKSHAIVPVPVFSKDVLECVFNQSTVPLDQKDRNFVEAYDSFNKILASQTGSTCIPLNKLKVESSIINAMVAEGIFTLLHCDGRIMIQDAYDTNIETKIYEMLNNVVARQQAARLPKIPSVINLEKMDASQQGAVNAMFTNAVYVLNAGAGRGKSYVTMKSLCAAAISNGSRVLLATPTNASLLRLLSDIRKTLEELSPSFAEEWEQQRNTWNNPSSTLEEIKENLTKLPAGSGTIILCTVQSIGFNNDFKCDGLIELEDIDILAVDEASMLSFKDIYKLLCVLPSLRLVGFIGDINQNPPVGAPSAMMQLIRVCNKGITGWVLITLTVCYRDKTDERLIVENCDRILKREDLVGISDDYTTAWVNIAATSYESVAGVAADLMKHRGLNKLQFLQRTMILGYNRECVARINDVLSEFIHPNLPPVSMRHGNWFVGDKVVFMFKRQTETEMVYNNTTAVIIGITILDKDITEVTLKKALRDNDDSELIWLDVSCTQKKGWWRYRLELDDGSFVTLCGVDSSCVQPAFAGTSTRAQSLSSDIVVIWYPTDPKIQKWPRPVEDIYLGPSRGEKCVVQVGDLAFAYRLLKREKTNKAHCPFPNYFSPRLIVTDEDMQTDTIV